MTKENDNYTPIECGLHSEYELAIMHKTKIILSWIDSSNEKQTETVEPIDLITREKQEYLKIKKSNTELSEIRLDKIIQFMPVNID